jgi:hypothetical protein
VYAVEHHLAKFGDTAGDGIARSGGVARGEPARAIAIGDGGRPEHGVATVCSSAFRRSGTKSCRLYRLPPEGGTTSCIGSANGVGVKRSPVADATTRIKLALGLRLLNNMQGHLADCPLLTGGSTMARSHGVQRDARNLLKWAAFEQNSTGLR